jgi:hypothetical protein
MTDATDTTAEAPRAGVQFVVLGGDTSKHDFEDGMTVQDVLDRANATVEDGQVVTVDGAPAKTDQALEPGAVVQVVGRVKNG